MLSRFGIPRLSYAQLFSFQVLYSNNADSRGFANSGTFGLLGRKKGEWKRAILEVDYTMGTLFLQDKDRIIVCIVHDLGPQEAAEAGVAKGLVGLDKEVMKYGLVNRRAKTAYKKDERFLVIVPGKLLLFKGMDIAGKHVRFVTSLFGASTHEELTGWIGAIEKSSLFANEGPGDSKRQNLQNARADRRRDPAYRYQDDPGYVGKCEPSSRDTRRDNFDAAVQQGFSMNRSKDYEGSDLRQGSNRHKVDREYIDREFENQERERDLRNQGRDERSGDPVESRGFRENFRQDRDRRVMDSSNGVGQINELNIQPPRRSLEQGRERDQHKAFNNGRQNDQRFRGVSNYQELSETSNQSAIPIRSPRKDNPDQRTMDNSQIYTRYVHGEEGKCAGLESGEGCVARGNKESQGVLERHEERSAGKCVVPYAQSAFDRGNADNLPEGTRGNQAWEGNFGPHVEAGTVDQESSTSKLRHRSSTHSALVSAQLNQQLPPQTSLRKLTDIISENKRGSKEEQEKMLFYMGLYRKGLIDAYTQTK
eukprot:c15264_g1_i1 orf=133-1740(+)